jgi:hypothetical protein
MDTRKKELINKLTDEIIKAFNEIVANDLNDDDQLRYVISLTLSAHLSSLVAILKGIGKAHPEYKGNIENICAEELDWMFGSLTKNMTDENPANALAKMLIYLFEQGLITNGSNK